MKYLIVVTVCLVSVVACQTDTSERGSIHVPFDVESRIEQSSRIPASIVRRIGSADGADDMLGQPLSLHVDTDGRIHVLDARLRAIKVFSEDGTLVASHSIRGGEGPGEVFTPRSLTLTSSEDAYVLYDLNQNMLTVLDRAFEVRNAFSPRQRPLALTSFGDDLILGAISQMMQEGDSLLHVWNLEGNRVRSFLPRHPFHETLINDPQFGWAPTNAIASSGDRIFVAYGFPVDLEFYDVGSGGARLIKRYQSEHESVAGYPKYYGAAVCANDRYVIRVILDSENEQAYFDIYDSYGNHVGIVDLSEQLGLVSITSCFSNSISDDNVVYGPSYERGFPEILAIHLDLP